MPYLSLLYDEVQISCACPVMLFDGLCIQIARLPACNLVKLLEYLLKAGFIEGLVRFQKLQASIVFGHCLL